MPCARNGARKGAASPQQKDTTATPSSAHTATRARWSQARTRLTPKGRSVKAFVRRICARVWAGSAQDKASMPRPPALDTAAASSGVVALPKGAWMMGC